MEVDRSSYIKAPRPTSLNCFKDCHCCEAFFGVNFPRLRPSFGPLLCPKNSVLKFAFQFLQKDKDPCPFL